MNGFDIFCKCANVAAGACAATVITKGFVQYLPELAVHPVVKKVGIYAIASAASVLAGKAVESDIRGLADSAKAFVDTYNQTKKDKEKEDDGDPEPAAE